MNNVKILDILAFTTGIMTATMYLNIRNVFGFFTFVLFTVCDGQNFVKPCKNFIIITVLNVF